MITKAHKILGGMLAVQILLAVLLLAKGGSSAPATEHPLVTGLDVAKVTKVAIYADGGEKPSVELAKKGTTWVLASHFDYPVEEKKVTDLLAPIPKLSAATPSATQAGGQNQLRVGDKQFDRKLVISQEGGQDLVLYVGKPNAARTSVRVGTSQNAYSASGITTSAIGTEPTSWVEFSYFKAPSDVVDRLTVTHDGKKYELVKTEPAPAAGSGSAGSGSAGSGSAGSGSAAAPPPPWSFTIDGAPVVLAKDETIDTASIESLLGLTAAIDLKAPGDPKLDGSKAIATIEIHRKGAAATAVDTLEVLASGEDYWVHQKGLPRAAIVDGGRLQTLVTIARDTIVKKPPPPGTGSAAPQPQLPPGIPPDLPIQMPPQ